MDNRKTETTKDINDHNDDILITTLILEDITIKLKSKYGRMAEITSRYTHNISEVLADTEHHLHQPTHETICRLTTAQHIVSYFNNETLKQSSCGTYIRVSSFRRSGTVNCSDPFPLNKTIEGKYISCSKKMAKRV